MLKKIAIIFVIYMFSGFFSVNAVGEKKAYQDSLKELDTLQETISKANKSGNEVDIANAKKAYDAKASTINSEIKAKKEAYDNSPESAGDVSSRGFTIETGDISPGMATTGSTSKESINFLFSTIIQNMMIALGSLALIIMTFGAGYMIVYHGTDELLTKGKFIFMAGIYSLLIALSSYYLVSIVRFLLYSGDN